MNTIIELVKIALKKAWEIIWKIIITGVILMIVWFFFILPLGALVFNPCPENEWTFFLRCIELVGMIVAFAVLRIYNAIVANTRFMIKLRESVVKIQRMLPGLDKTLKDLRASQAVLKSSIDKAEKTIKNSDSE